MPVTLTGPGESETVVILEDSETVVVLGDHGGVVVESATAPGPPGPPGADGTGGAGGGVSVPVTTPANLVVVQHNLPYKPAAVRFLYEGNESNVWGPSTIAYPSSGILVATFPEASPFHGIVHVS